MSVTEQLTDSLRTDEVLSPFLFGDLQNERVEQEIKLRETAGLMALVEGTVASTRALDREYTLSSIGH